MVVCALYTRSFRKYLPLNAYMVGALLFTVSRYIVFTNYGYTSPQYFYFYYYSDALLIILLYFAVMGLYSHVFQELGAHRYVRTAAIALLGLTALFSYLVVAGAKDRLVTHFVVEIGQNMNFVGVVLTYLLWVSMLKLRETRTHLIQLVLALGVYFSAFAASYALRNLYPELQVWRFVSHFMALGLPVAWAYTFLKIPEEARLAPARVAAPNR